MIVNKKVADAIRVIEGAAAEKLESLKKSWQKQHEKLNALERQQEILADISFGIGWRWSKLADDVEDGLREAIGGGRALIDLCKEWAVEFDTMWEGLAATDPKREDYFGEIDIFIDEKYATLLAIHRLENT